MPNVCFQALSIKGSTRPEAEIRNYRIAANGTAGSLSYLPENRQGGE